MILILVGLLVLASLAYFYSQKKGSWNSEVYSDFAIEDTASVDRIFIADYLGGSVDLVKSEDGSEWWVKDKYRAKDYSVRILLKCFHDIEVKSPITKSKRENIISAISSKGTKVEIYSNGKLNKTYLIGTCAQDQKGTYMVLERGDGSRSAEPLNMYMKKFTGCLKQRFFTENEEWRYTGIFEYPELDFERVSLDIHDNPEFSYSIEFDGENGVDLYDGQGDKQESINELNIKNYLILFKKVHFETYQSYLSPAQEDSLNQVPPAYTFTVEGPGDQKKSVDLFFMKPFRDYEMPDGSISPYDLERMYGRDQEGRIGLVQTYVFNPLLKELPYFK